MTISFLLHSGIRKPSGGVKIILDYANALAEKGHTVFIIQPCFLSKKTTSFFNALRRFIYYKLTQKYEPNWFKTDKNVHGKLVWSLAEKNVPKSDAFIATYVETAFWLDSYKECKKKYYFIQDFENWYVDDLIVKDSYKLDLSKIVISDWLLNEVYTCNQKAILIPNGFDTKIFKIDKVYRNSKSLLFMWHEDERKRCEDTIQAIILVKAKIPDIQINIFSAFQDPNIKDFEYTFYHKAAPNILAKLYNENYVYVAASREEGWGLTIGEAMLCGCAVACTDNRGFRIMAENEVSALVSPVYDYEQLAKNIIRLLKDSELHDKLVTNAYEKMKIFSVEESRNKFIEIVTQ